MKLMEKFKIIVADWPIEENIGVLNPEDAIKNDISVNDKLIVEVDDKKFTIYARVSEKVEKGHLLIFKPLADMVGVKEGDEASITITDIFESLAYIRKKMHGKHLSKDEIYTIINDVVSGKLTEVEIAAFLLSQMFHGMSMSEIEYLTRAMVETGEVINFERVVYDKHSLGGVPGNKVSLLIVPIVAAAGLFIPKTSSKAITSPSGTADTMSVLAPVEFTVDELKEVALKAGGCIVWGGSLNLAPADDIFINVERKLRIDPESQMLASIMAKKLAVKANYLVIDIPTGPGTKAPTVKDGRRLAHLFVELGERLDMQVQCGITYGGQPIGHSVGPALEAKEALKALHGDGPTSLLEKSTALAGLLLEMGGVAHRGHGKELAYKILNSGKALKKMREIIEAQGGDPSVKPEDIPIGEHVIEIRAPCDGYVTHVSNSAITAIARAAGAPKEKGAGVVTPFKRGHKVNKGDVIMVIHAERATKLQQAYSLAQKLKPITIEGMLLYTYPEYV